MKKLLLFCSVLFLGSVTTPAQETTIVSFNTPKAVYAKAVLPVVNSETTQPNFVAIETIEFIEDEVEEPLGFDVEKYLPRWFNPHEAYIDVSNIEYIEDEVDEPLGFDVNKYLPRWFNPHEPYFNAAAIEFIETEPKALVCSTTSL